MDQYNRESWLNRVAAGMAPLFEALDAPLPHARLDTGGETTAPRKQATRMLKCECQACGYTVRTARKWLEMAGAPVCPIARHGSMQHDPLNEDGDDKFAADALSH